MLGLVKTGIVVLARKVTFVLCVKGNGQTEQHTKVRQKVIRKAYLSFQLIRAKSKMTTFHNTSKAFYLDQVLKVDHACI